jgi:serine/threonine protein kinase
VTVATAHRQPDVGDLVGSYRLEELLGQGATGRVFRARREDDGEVVALKLLKGELSSDDVYRRRFEREARAASEIQSDHLVSIVDAGEADGRHYLAMAYVSGPTLATCIETDGPLDVDKTLRLAGQVAAGLDALHAHGLVHRDVKPSNIMLTEDEGRAALTDFGLVKGRAHTVLTRPGQVLGTLHYMAPELIRGETAERACDIYALGCVVYECLTGGPPFAGAQPFQVGVSHLQDDPPEPATRRPDLPGELSSATLQALAKEPRERPPTATAYVHMLHVSARSRR